MKLSMFHSVYELSNSLPEWCNTIENYSDVMKKICDETQKTRNSTQTNSVSLQPPAKTKAPLVVRWLSNWHSCQLSCILGCWPFLYWLPQAWNHLYITTFPTDISVHSHGVGISNDSAPFLLPPYGVAQCDFLSKHLHMVTSSHRHIVTSSCGYIVTWSHGYMVRLVFRVHIRKNYCVKVRICSSLIVIRHSNSNYQGWSAASTAARPSVSYRGSTLASFLIRSGLSAIHFYLQLQIKAAGSQLIGLPLLP